MGARPAIPRRRTEERVACPAWIDNDRNRVERLWARLQERRAVATHYETTARVHLAGSEHAPRDTRIPALNY
jgi:hypothetical protein